MKYVILNRFNKPISHLKSSALKERNLQCCFSSSLFSCKIDLSCKIIFGKILEDKEQHNQFIIQ